MPTELEAKYRVLSHDPVRGALRAAGAESLGTVSETNVILDSADGTLRRAGSGLRVRSAASVDGGPPRVTVTYKGPVRRSVFKSREEIEFAVSDAAAALAMLGALGFVVILRYTKRRETWRLSDCLVELDTPPGIGLFVEIEGPSEPAIRTVRDRLGLERAELVPESYVRLLMAAGLGRDGA